MFQRVVGWLLVIAGILIVLFGIFIGSTRVSWDYAEDYAREATIYGSIILVIGVFVISLGYAILSGYAASWYHK